MRCLWWRSCEYISAMSIREQAEHRFKAKQFVEASQLYRQVVDANPADENAWQHLALSLRNAERFEDVISACKEALRVHPRSSWLWRELGNVCIKLDHLEEAEKALNQARRIEPGAAFLWRYYGQLHRKRKSYNDEAKALEELVELGIANSTDLNQLGIAYHDAKNYGRALLYYRESALANPDSGPYYNMGLVFTDPEVSQDADAADAYRRALRINPTYTKAQEKLAATEAKLTPLAERALVEANGLVRSDERYQHYLNPYEVLQVDAEAEELDIKVLQRAKKKLLQELDLNEGKVSWLDEQPLDKSRVLAIEEELDDPDKQEYHRLIFRNEPLLRFLTHGDIRHFLYSDDYFPEEALDLLDQDAGFRAFLSKPFATQYNAMLSRAIDKKALAVIEVLFDGRRWVEDADLENCLSGAFKKVRHLVDIIQSLEKESETRLVGFPEVQNALKVHGIVGLFNLLPAPFRAQQTQMVACLRSLAINCHNKHGQTAISKSILLLCKQFHFKSHALNERLKEDYEKIEELLAQQTLSTGQGSSLLQRKPSIASQVLQRARDSHSPSSNAGRHTAIPSTREELASPMREMKRAALFIGLLIILAIGGTVCNRAVRGTTENSRYNSQSKSIVTSADATRPSGEVLFDDPERALRDSLSLLKIPEIQPLKFEPIKPIKLEPIKPIKFEPIKAPRITIGEMNGVPAVPIDDGWDEVKYYNGQTPECFNYAPRYDRELDNQLRVTVGGGTDVVIKVMEASTDRCIRYVYIKSRSTYAIRNIPQGRYYLKIAYGKRWVEKKEAGMCIGKFASNPLYEKGEDILDFRTRSTGISYENGQRYENYEIPSFEIQLDVVTTGFSNNSLNTDGISEAEFNQ